MTTPRTETRTGGRRATTGVIPGRFSISVGNPPRSAPDGWRWQPLTDLARLETGHTPSRRHPEYWGGDIPWVGIKDATAHHGRTIYETNQYTNELGIANSSARVLPANTVCLSRTASVGIVVVMGKPMATSQDFVSWICGDDLDYRFLKAVLLAEGSDLLQFASGTTHQTIYFPEVKAFHICAPSIEEQRRIAGILEAIEQKIELNRQTSQTLEEIARAIFKSWFVDFDPVHAKAEGSNPNLPDHIAALFPDSFEDSEVGQAPKGWPVTPLSEVLTESRKRVGDTEAPEYSSTNEGLQLRSERFKKQLAKTSVNNKLVRKGDLVFGLSRRVLNFGLMRHELGSVSAAYRVFAVDSDAVQPDLLEQLMRMHPDYFYGAVSASSREGQSVSPESVGLLRFVQPDIAVQDTYHLITAPLKERTERLREESTALVSLRDSLLPRLISGEIRLQVAS
ncbi:MAG: restriction endonuclease subunit S [Actinomycetota bacterium]